MGRGGLAGGCGARGVNEKEKKKRKKKLGLGFFVDGQTHARAVWRTLFFAAAASRQGLHAFEDPENGLQAEACATSKQACRTISRFLCLTVSDERQSFLLAGDLSPAPATYPEVVTERAAPPPLFGLAPHGVYPAGDRYRRRGALLPHLFTLTGQENPRPAVFFLWHFP